eukprot:CAMPEP_0117473458 /NCGR_PEP_ID=MMETSP0784-20121206/8782_1 /TAXON_ID=39447 /ORGANISM="" /LENGTH=169 /DNA_ID=CAMNT_0005267659 /DNA_START=219 /DNA_END=728 /DNA_ORIENTATION=-
MQTARERTEEEEELLLKSLLVQHDERYAKMEHYRKNGGDDHFERICKSSALMSTISKRVDMENDDGPGPALYGRMEWQDNFDRSVKRLFVDFELTDFPAGRLKHVDRMYKWFEEHGQKQVRKAQRGPNYLVADRRQAMPPGSTRNIPSRSSAATEILAGAYSLLARLPS